jgi:hypothetical protein
LDVFFVWLPIPSLSELWVLEELYHNPSYLLGVAVNKAYFDAVL